MNIDSKYSVFGNCQISLNWIDYLKGIKLVDEEDVFFTFQTNFYVALLDQAYSPVFATFITPQDEP